MPVITVNGEINPKDLGITAIHEHILIDIRKRAMEFEEVSRKILSEQKVDITNLGILRRNRRALKDNLIISDINLAVQELLEFKKAGGRTVADMTSVGMGRDPIALREISSITGINIITGCGYYTEEFHPDYLKDKSIKELAEEMIDDIKIGIGQTNVKAGIIGEIGTSKEISADEKKVLNAACIAQVETGAAISIHIDPWCENGLQALDILKSNNVNLTRAIICHVDVKQHFDYCKAVLDQGAMIEFDNFGKEFINDKDGVMYLLDLDRIRLIKKFIDLGYIKQLLMSTDICLKTDLIKYGGWGYSHILTNILPLLLMADITRKEINEIIAENPKKILNID